jgi:hypothetical protein
MEGLINDYASFDMEDALEDFKRFIKEKRILYFFSRHRSPHFYARG